MESLKRPDETGAARQVERRRGERKKVKYMRLLSPIPAWILDLSSNGLALEAMVELRVGKEYRLRIRHRMRIMTVVGTVRSCHLSRDIHYSKDKSLPLYRAGIEFSKEMSASDLEFLSLEGDGPRRMPAFVESPAAT